MTSAVVPHSRDTICDSFVNAIYFQRVVVR